MSELSTERLEKFVNDIKTDGMCDITDYQVALALRQLLAYEQAADRPVGEIFRCSGNKTLRWWNDVPEGTVLYAAPVLPKQPELMSIGELLQRLEEQTGEKWVEESEQPTPMAFDEAWENKGHLFVDNKQYAALFYWLGYKAAPAQLVSEPYKLAKSPETCTWISDGEGLWLGDCGATWQFFDDGPNENGLKYCPSCGKKVSVIAAPAQESE